MSTKSVLFGERAAGVYRMSEIYIPSEQEGVTPEQSGKIVPAVGSLIVDDTTGLHNQQYTVTAVDPITYEPTLVPSTFVVDSTAQVDRVLSYGNDIFMIYFSSIVMPVSGSNVNLTRLIIDNKLSLFGKHAATYQLIRTDEDGNESIISRRYVPGDSGFEPAGTIIPMLDTGVEGIRKCDGCYTDVTLTEGEDIRCDIYTAGGILIAQIHLIAKKGHLLNEPVDQANPIVGMTIEGSQMESNGDLYLFYGQDERELAIYVHLEYRDGSSRTVGIDNRRGFCYGLETVSSHIVGARYQITIKYYLSSEEAASPSIAEEAALTRFISKDATIKIISGAKDLISKVSPIPIWNTVAREWSLQFLRYRDDRSITRYHTDDPNDYEHVTIDSDFNGKLFNTSQSVTISYDEIVNNLGQKARKTASFIIELRDKGSGVLFGEYYLIKDSMDSLVTYGSNTPPHLRPRIKYRANSGYFIPDEVFKENSNQSATEVFIENFYTNANPPKHVDESAAPMPTHFRVKTPSGNAITPNAIAIDEFTTNLNLIVPNGENQNYYVNKTVIVEFLKQIDSTTCEYLYGVPVEVI